MQQNYLFSIDSYFPQHHSNTNSAIQRLINLKENQLCIFLSTFSFYLRENDEQKVKFHLRFNEIRFEYSTSEENIDI